MSHNNQKKIAVINDFTGFGRCSLAVALPVISSMRVQCCPLPTAVLSNHTGFESFSITDFTDRMDDYVKQWKKLGLEFNGIASGYLGSVEQIEIVERFFEIFDRPDNVIVVDPVMGDYGKLYSTYTMDICQELKKLVAHADIVTPNLTEACILVDAPYNEKYKNKDIDAIARKLADMGPGKVVITGIPRGQFIMNYCYESGGEGYYVKTMKVGTQRSGTGDIFSSIIAADAVNGVDFNTSVRKASAFVKNCIKKAIEMEIPVTDGVPFEELLHRLR